MAKPRKSAAKKATRTIRRAPPPAGDTAMYEVLTPFKFLGAVVKPPALVELTAAQAYEYQEAGVLGTEPGEVPGATDTRSEQQS